MSLHSERLSHERHRVGLFRDSLRERDARTVTGLHLDTEEQRSGLRRMLRNLRMHFGDVLVLRGGMRTEQTSRVQK